MRNAMWLYKKSSFYLCVPILNLVIVFPPQLPHQITTFMAIDVLNMPPIT